MSKNKELSREEELVKLLLSMKSLEITELSPLSKPLKETIAALYRADRTETNERFELVNRILNLILSDSIVSPESFAIVFREIDFSNNKKVEECIRKFNYACLLEFGSTEEGYELFRKDGDWLKYAWEQYFSPLKTSEVDLPIDVIEATKLYCLGYLAYDQKPELNDARRILREILEEGLKRRVKDNIDLEDLAMEKGYTLRQIVGKSGVPHAERLLWSVIPPNFSSFFELIAGVRHQCLELTEEEIDKIQKIGEENTKAYLSTQDIDVYIATSMREPLDFITNWYFVEALKENEEIKRLNLTFFDPTQAYFPDRIQKGILECLMIERASITIYNAQELETFGKDAEAGITLAHGKPVIIYVPRLFELRDLSQKEIESLGKEKIKIYEEFKEIYYNLDELALKERKDFLKALIEKDYLDANKDADLFKEAKDKRHAIARLIKNKFEPLLNQLEINEISSELMRKGYIDGKKMPLKKEKLINHCIEKIQNLEVRGLLFRELHPLTFQMSPIDGVVRGSFITRSINETARLLRCFFKGELKYDIIKIKNNQVLVESDTRSPIRAFPENAMIKNALSEVHSLRRAQIRVS